MEIKPFRKVGNLYVNTSIHLSPFNFKASNYVKINWEKAPFTRIIPLMKVLPDVFDTNTMWTYLIEQGHS